MSRSQRTNPPAVGRGYQRSWKNLLINRRYQLRFTLFMVALSAALIVGLGLWVLGVADDATSVATIRVRSEVCPAFPAESSMAPVAPAAGAIAPSEPAPVAAPAEPAAGEALEAGRRRVHIDESSITIEPPPVVVPDRAARASQVAAYWSCKVEQISRIAELGAGRQRILIVLVLSGIVTVFGLALYGIKMTHRVAGPLFKVSLYLAKMRDGRFDTVYNLRKGDQLVEFYEAFKAAHAGVKGMENADIDRLRAVIAAAEKAGIAGKSGHVDGALAELKTMLARKEAAVE